MRNLLSFVLGVISRLLYLLLRLILLLDRTICRVYDLPVWSRFAGVLRQAGRRRSVCALSVFGLLFLLPALLLTRPGTLLLADGQPLGVIEDSATLLNAVNAVESSASAVSGTDYYLPLRLQAKPVRTSAPLLTQEELERNLITASGELDTLAIISVDGKQTAIAADTDGAQAALDRIKAATQIMIAPLGYEFRIVRNIITNFHQPKSTLLLLVSAFAGEDWRRIYDYALSHDFRFLSYGDSSVLIR